MEFYRIHGQASILRRQNNDTSVGNLSANFSLTPDVVVVHYFGVFN